MNSNTLLKLIKFGIGFILFIPLYIGGSFYFPFIFPKIWLFQLVVEIIFFLYVVLALADSRFRPKCNRVLGAVLLLTLVLIITGLTGVDAFRSFWGNTERMSGIIAWLHFVAFAAILSGVLSTKGGSASGGKTEKEWRSFFGVAVIVSILEFFYVLGQHFNVSWAQFPSSRAGTIGNADLLGTYAIFSAFFALYLWQSIPRSVLGKSSRTNPGIRYFWAAAFVMNIGTMFIASSRGAILGFAAGLAVYGIFSVWKNKQARKIWAIMIAVLLLAYGAFFLARDTDFVKNNVQLTRLANVSLKSDTVQQRFTEWGIAWDAFKARPVFGWGPNNYLYLHNAFLNPRVYELRETNFDRAHNAYLDYASMSGILGLAGYIILIAVLFWTFVKGNVKTMAALVAAYAVQSFFVFDSPASYIALFFLIGYAIYIRDKRQATNDKNIANPKIFNSQTIIALSLVAGLLSFYVFWQVSVKPASANITFVRAFNDSSVSPEDAFDFYKKSVAQETLGTTEFRNQYVNWLQKILNNFKPEERMAVLDFGIGELEKEAKIHPAVFSYLNLGQLYNYKARGFQDPSIRDEFFKKTANAYDQALKLSPNRLEVYYSYLQLCFDAKNYAKGVELMKTASSNAPNYWQPRWYLGLAEVAAGNDAAAVEAINKALVIFYNPENIAVKNGRLEFDYEKSLKFTTSFAPKTEILGAVNPYIRLKMWPELLLLYLSAEKGDPSDTGIHQSLALVYQNLGFQDKALGELKIIDSLKK
ncbi:O-antigen ligase family protein [Candidatus Wolfebacteria bacterium]|nr:O-antigen ligase family protein [Candidatus Wolfebacteria bacterium]